MACRWFCFIDYAVMPSHERLKNTLDNVLVW
jgi:hypothetical protein